MACGGSYDVLDLTILNDVMVSFLFILLKCKVNYHGWLFVRCTAH